MTSSTYIIVGILAAAGILFLLAILPRLVIRELPTAELTSVADLKDRLALRNERVKLRNEFRTTCVSFLGGLGLLASVLVAFGQFRSSQEAVANSVETSRVQLDIAQQAARSQQFVDTVDNLGDDKVAVRVAAVEVLDDIAQYGHDQAVEVNSILRAYVQESSPWPPPQNAAYPADADATSIPRLAARSPEVNIAMRRLGERALADLQTVIEGADLRRADLRDNDYTDGYFGHVRMGSSELTGADFTKTDFVESDLSHSDLSGSKLCGALLSTSDLTGAILTGAVADDETTWPPDFDPEGAGVRQASGKECTP